MTYSFCEIRKICVTIPMKTVKAVAPYQFKGGISFKTKTYEAWIAAGGQAAEAHYPPRWAHIFAHRLKLPSLWKNKSEARLRFVQPVTMLFDTFPDYPLYEIIPFMWDTWEPYHDVIAAFFKRYQVRTAIFCASQTAEVMKRRFPEMNIITITEGVDTTLYKEGKPLYERSIDLIEFGRSNKEVFNVILPDKYTHLRSNSHSKLFTSDSQFYDALSDSKITIAFPKKDTCPEETGFVETLTQRYWENMLSRTLMVGRAPLELIDLLGYNPVININCQNTESEIISILSNINHYQDLVDRNRDVALQLCDWSIRMEYIQKQLKNFGYKI